MSRTRQSLAAEQKFLAKVAEMGGKVMSPYITTNHKIDILCKNGHLFTDKVTHISNDDRWCKFCLQNDNNATNNNKEIKLLSIIQERNGILLTPYIDGSTEITVECENHHKFVTSAESIFNGQWCKICYRENIQGNIEQRLRSIIQNKGGILLTPYVNAITKVSIQCQNSHIWSVLSNGITQGSWCPQCPKRVSILAKEKFETEVKRKGGTLLTPYHGTHEHVTILCNRNHNFTAIPHSITSGNFWCQKCSGTGPEQRKENFYSYISQLGGKVHGEYINMITNVELECECSNRWSARPAHIMEGHWCPRCAGVCQKQASDNFYAHIIELEGNVNGIYSTAWTDIEVECQFGHKFITNGHSVQQGRWCRKCAGICPEQAAEKFYTRVAAMKGKLYGAYIDSKTAVDAECEFGHRFNVMPYNVSRGNFCSICNKSQGERMVCRILEKHNIPFTEQRSHPLLPRKRYDFYFQHNTREFYLEYDGEQHFEWKEFFCKTEEEFRNRQNVDILKSRTVVANGGYLIRLDYTLTDAEIETHILTALQGINPLYLSNPTMYAWITEGIQDNIKVIPAETTTTTTTTTKTVHTVPPVTTTTTKTVTTTTPILTLRVQAQPIIPNQTVPSPIVLPLLPNQILPSQRLTLDIMKPTQSTQTNPN